MRHSSIRRASLPLLLVGLMSCGGDDGSGPTDAPVPTSMTVSQSSVSLSYLGQVFGLTATVVDQFGGTVNATKTWASDDTSIATVTPAGQVTAVANGVTTLRVTSGSLSASASVTVQQVATLVAAVSGDGQTGTVGQALAEPVVVTSVDQGGFPVPGASITFTVAGTSGSVTVTEATTDAGALTSTAWTLGTTSGTQHLSVAITGAGNTPRQLTATAVAGPPAAIVKASGDGQTAPVGFAVSEPVTVKLTDAFGNGVVGGSVSFAVTGGGGSVTPSQTSTIADGTAQVTWTMGAGLGVNTLSATASGLAAVEFSATAVAAMPDLAPGAITTSPANPTALQSFEVSATVTNVGHSTASAGVQVQLLLDGANAGTVTLPTLALGASSDATFTVGPLSAGSHTLQIVVDPGSTLNESNESNNTTQHTTDIPVTTLLTAGTPISGISAADSVEHLFTLVVPPSSPGTVVITLNGGSGDADLYVHRGDRPAHRDDYKTCLSGNPDTTERCVINAAEPGTYHILVFAWTAFSGTTILAETGQPVIPYNIELVFVNHGTPAQDSVFEAAAARWMEIIPGDISDFDYSNNPVDISFCVEGQPLLDDLIDDLRIYVSIAENDGPGGVLASAGWCDVRGLGHFPIIGTMEFDSEDLDDLSAIGQLDEVVMHEMGHVLGLGTLWGPSFHDLIRNPSRPSNAGADTHFVGPRAIEAFDAAGGSTYTLGSKVPVENTADEGSADSHWRESVLDTELMTSGLDIHEENPLSAITIESLADLGYTVDITQAEPYFAVFGAPPRLQASSTVIDLGGDLRQGPVYVVDEKGRRREVVRR